MVGGGRGSLPLPPHLPHPDNFLPCQENNTILPFSVCCMVCVVGQFDLSSPCFALPSPHTLLGPLPLTWGLHATPFLPFLPVPRQAAAGCFWPLAPGGERKHVSYPSAGIILPIPCLPIVPNYVPKFLLLLSLSLACLYNLLCESVSSPLHLSSPSDMACDIFSDPPLPS